MTAVLIASTEIVRVKYGESTATMTAVRIASTEIVRVKYGASTATMIAVRVTSTEIVRAKPGASAATMTAVGIASTEIVRVKYDASTQFLGESPKMETYFAVIIIIIIINLQNCVKSQSENLWGQKEIWGNSGIEWRMLKCTLKVAWRLDSTVMPS